MPQNFVYFGPEPSFQRSTLPKLTPEQWQDFDRRARAFRDELTLLSQKWAVVVGHTDYEDIGLIDRQDERLNRDDLDWDDTAGVYYRTLWDSKRKKYRREE